MITAPQQIRVNNPGGYPVDSTALTKEGIASDFNSQAAADESASRDDAQHPAVEDEYRLAPPEAIERRPSNSPTAPPTAWIPDDQPLVPSDHWTSDSSTKTRQYLLVGFLGITGVGLSVVLFVAFLRWYGAKGDGTPGDGIPQTTMADASAIGPGSALLEPDEVQVDNTDGDQGSNSPEIDNTSPPVESPASTDSPGTDSIDGTASLPGTASPPVTGGDTALAASDAALPAGLLGDDLAGSDPLNSGLVGGELSTNAGAQSAKAALPQALQELADVLDWNLQPVEPDTDVIPDAPPVTAAELGLQIGSRSAAIPPLDYARHAQTVLPGLLLGKEQPLWYTINLWTQISGVPSVVDIDAMAAANIDRQMGHEIGKSESSSIDDVAHWLAAKLELEVDAVENRYLQFSVPSKRIKEKLPMQISVKELLSGEEQNEWLIGMLTQLFPPTAGGWNVADGKLSCVAEKVDLPVWFNVVRLLENWRAAATLPSALEGYAPGRVLNKFVQQASLQQLEQEISEVSPQATPVGQRLSDLCATAGLECWIDWPNVGANGLGPNTTALAVTHRRQFGRVLADFASQFALVLAIEDERTVWLTTPIAYRLQPRLYVLENDGRTPEQVQQLLKPLTPLNMQGVGMIDAIATPDNRFMIIRCCRPIIQYPGVL